SHEYIGSAGNKSLALMLSKDASVIADGHAMAYMDALLAIQTDLGGVGKALGRWFGGEDLFLNKYTGTGATQQRIVLSMPFPGDIIDVKLSAGKGLKVSRNAFLAASPASVDITGKMNWRALIPVGQDEGLVLTKVSAPPESDAVVWLASYGHIEKHTLKTKEERMLVDNENFLACDVDVGYTIASVGGLKSLVFGGESFAMEFVGPCELYTQTKGLKSFAATLQSFMTVSEGSGISIGF
ncbi:hypothetical protein TSOC_012502, partial [Tetrabaena socialis]